MLEDFTLRNAFFHPLFCFKCTVPAPYPRKENCFPFSIKNILLVLEEFESFQSGRWRSVSFQDYIVKSSVKTSSQGRIQHRARTHEGQNEQSKYS